MVTWNPADKGPGVTLSLGDLLASSPDPSLPGAASYTYNSGSFLTIRATGLGVTSSGKFYWEIQALPRIAGDRIDIAVGISQKGAPPGSNPDEWPLVGTYASVSAETQTVYRSATGRLQTGNVPYGPLFNFGNNNNIGVLMDLDNLTLSFRANGVQLPPATTLISTAIYYPVLILTQGSALVNFGSSAFEYPLPDGYQPYDNFMLTGNTTNIAARCRREVSQGSIGVSTANAQPAGINNINTRVDSTAGKYKVGDDVCPQCRTLINSNDIVIDQIELDDKQSGRLSG